MIIGFDARMVHHSGIGTYVQNLLSSILAQNSRHSFVLFGPQKILEARLGAPNGRIRFVNCTLPIYSLAEQFRHPALRERLDLFHAPHYNFPLFAKPPLIVTLHDITHLRYPEFHTSVLAYPYARWMIGQALKQARGIICVSQATREDLARFYGKTPRAVSVIHEAVRSDFGPQPPAEIWERLKKDLGLPEVFGLYVGNLKPHKNISRLIRIFRRWKKMPLVLVGKRFSRHAVINRELAQAEREGLLRSLENLDSPLLQAVFGAARFFISLSLHEGFGLPVLEAFHSGTPVIVSNRSAFPEIAGRGALLVDPQDDAEVIGAMNLVITSEPLRRKMILRGRQELARFSWERAAQETLRVYENSCRP